MLRAKTHIDLYMGFIESVSEVMDEIQVENNRLKKDKDYEEITQVHKTGIIIRRWFFKNGGLAL